MEFRLATFSWVAVVPSASITAPPPMTPSPSLKNAGISNPLADPIVELHDGNGALTAVNDNWQEGDSNSIRDTGLGPQDPAESVISRPCNPATTPPSSAAKKGAPA